MASQSVSCGVKSIVSLWSEKFCVLVTHWIDRDFLRIGVAIGPIVLKVTGITKRGNARNCFVKQSFSRGFHLSERLFPSPQFSNVMGTKDTSLCRRCGCSIGRFPSVMDIRREHDHRLYSPLVRTRKYHLGGRGDQITVETFRIGQRSTPRCKINRNKNFVIVTTEF